MRACARGHATRLATRRAWLIHLRVVTQDGDELTFESKRRAPLGKLMRAFSARQGISMNAVRFLFDGQRLGTQQTPDELEMEEGDVIDVMVEQMGD